MSERTPAWPLESRKRLLHALALVMVQAIGFFVAGPALLAPFFLGKDTDPFAATPGSCALFAFLALLDVTLVIGLGLLRFGRVRLTDLGWRTENVGRSIGLGVAGFVACGAVTLGLWLSLHPGGSLGEFASAVSGASAAQRGLFLLIGLQAAFVEETLFRGYLQPTLVARSGVWLGIALMALIFALYHLNFRPVGLAGKLAFGIVFGVLRQRDGSLFAPAIAHALLWAVVGAM